MPMEECHHLLDPGDLNIPIFMKYIFNREKVTYFGRVDEECQTVQVDLGP